MKITLQYLNDMAGNPQAIQMPISEWQKVLNKLQKYEQTLKLRSDLKEAFEQVAILRESKGKKQNLSEFLKGILSSHHL